MGLPASATQNISEDDMELLRYAAAVLMAGLPLIALLQLVRVLPEDARVVKTIGDEVMIVGNDPAALVDWAVGFQQLHRARPRPRIGIHYGEVLYRDGDYYGREVNQAARVSARAAGGEVLVTQPIVDASELHLEFEFIGEVRLKGFAEATELYVARQTPD